jgi:hypothetical protein
MDCSDVRIEGSLEEEFLVKRVIYFFIIKLKVCKNSQDFGDERFFLV